MRYTKFTNCDLCDKGIILKKRDLFIDNETGKIIDNPNSNDVQTVDLEGNILAPGFLDIQNNGVYGLNFSSLQGRSTEEDIKDFKKFYIDVMRKYLTTGVTGMCPTVTSNFPDVYQKVLPLYKRTTSRDETDSLGAHCEGPFISKDKPGCHPIDTLVTVDKQNNFFKMYGDGNQIDDNVTILTASPEVSGVLESIRSVTDKKIVFSIGHTMTDYETGLKAIENGATMITHLYNAMPQPHHRDAGVVGLITSPKAENTPYFGMIADGVHVDPSMIVLAYRSNPDKCILVTDAMHLIGLADGLYKFDNRFIEKTGSRLYIQGTNTLAGAATTVPECLRNLISWSGISIADAIKTVTNNPAKSIGIENDRGFLNTGCIADLVVVDKDCYVKRIFKMGKEIKSSDIRNETLRASL